MLHAAMNDAELIKAAAQLCCDGIRDIAPRFTPEHADSKQEALDRLLSYHRRLGAQADNALDHWLTHRQMPNVSEELFEQIFFRLVGFEELFRYGNLGLRGLEPQDRTTEGLVRHTTITLWNDTGWPKRLFTLVLQRAEVHAPEETFEQEL